MIGSSPRMRGAHKHDTPELMQHRIIPADAGSTALESWTRSRDWDHPRGCGEHRPCTVTCWASMGSSPRMRGAPGYQPHHPRLQGIIPADAGSTRTAPTRPNSSRDHPRGCGEHFRACQQLRLSPGSSPRMRGAHTWMKGIMMAERIIPADAGSTIVAMVHVL